MAADLISPPITKKARKPSDTVLAPVQEAPKKPTETPEVGHDWFEITPGTWEQLPVVCRGDIVQWCHPGKAHDWFPAVVRRQGADGAVALTVINESPYIDPTRKACLWIDDPRVGTETGHGRGQYGTWDLTERHRELLSIRVQLAKILDKIGE